MCLVIMLAISVRDQFCCRPRCLLLLDKQIKKICDSSEPIVFFNFASLNSTYIYIAHIYFYDNIVHPRLMDEVTHQEV